MMAHLTDELRESGYEPTERESPFEEGANLWTNSYELVCEETGIVIRKSKSHTIDIDTDTTDDRTYTYRNSEKVKLFGGYVSSYDWGSDDDRFRY